MKTLRPIYLLCGVPGSGKTWVANQLCNKYEYIQHDDYLDGYVDELVKRATKGGAGVEALRILADCPFGERLLRDTLLDLDMVVHPIFIVESPSIVDQRYRTRGVSTPEKFLTRAATIIDRALEWKSPYGTSQEVLEMLRDGVKLNGQIEL